MTLGKRVCCLYRVSALKQVEKDDIPMQKQRCHEFAAQMGWDIVREFSEKGVSGFKVSAKQRDAIQEIQREAALNIFDILLVFMFDRLGRRDDETPFIVEWFVNNGIEVWSAEEGQQRFDNHVDKLLNYIRYWQASGESIKTSIRTKTRLGQIVMEGRFRGGYAPYGYQLVKKGRMGKKNRELFDIEVNPMEAAAVRRIFDLADQYGYGGRKTSTTLKEEGFINLRTGEPFHYSTIQNILINIAYTGVLRSGESISEIFPDLQIITPEQFQRVQKGREQRSADYLAKCAAAYGTETITLKNGSEAEVSRPIRSYPRKNTGSALLSGNVYCGHCGGRIFASTARKTHHPTDGSNGRVAIYKCYNRTQHKGNCDGPTTYRAEKVDAVVSKLIRDILQKAGAVSEYDIVRNQIGATASDLQQQIRQAKLELSKKHIEQGRWEGLMLDSLDGKCPFTPEQVKSRLDSVKEAMTSLSANIESLEARLTDSDRLTQELKDQHQQLLSWAEMFDNATPAERKLMQSIADFMVSLELPKQYFGEEFVIADKLAEEAQAFMTELKKCDGLEFPANQREAVASMIKRVLTTTESQFSLLETVLKCHEKSDAKAAQEAFDVMMKEIEPALLVSTVGGAVRFEIKGKASFRWPRDAYGYKFYMVRSAPNSAIEKDANEMFHIPSKKRQLASNERFSLCGFPSLYLSTMQQLAWQECGYPPEYYCSEFQYLLLDVQDDWKIIALSSVTATTSSVS